MNLPSIIKGILQTPNLWKGSELLNIRQFIIDGSDFQLEPISSKLRLGMFVEQCVFQSLENNSNYNVLAKNIQIIDNNLTLGELDCILKHNSSIVHLEIAYKFYLFDKTHNKNELHCWIGPNRKDSLIEKINKLQEKQFPLLQHPKTVEKLNILKIPTEQIEQQVCFKAQLFVHFSKISKIIPIINFDCIAGFYVNWKELVLFKAYKFYIPTKLDWLVVPKTDVTWLSYEHFIMEVNSLLHKKLAPLCWMKKNNGEMRKFFVVWW